MRNQRIIALTIVSIAFGVVAGACGMEKSTEVFKDAPRGEINGDPADILRMPDGFSNVAAKCDGTTRVYVLYKGDNPYGSVAAVANHPDCGGK